MAVLPIVLHPNEVLNRQAQAVKNMNASVRKLLADMVETMRAAKGQGLAAPQVGALRRVIVVEVGQHPLMELVNPEILSAGEAQETALEGCLSMPGLAAEVRRNTRVRVTALNRNGHRIWIDAEGELARCLQHEIDHLDGILMTDRALRVFDLTVDEVSEGAAE